MLNKNKIIPENLSRAHTTTRKHGIKQCYRYLLVDCVQKGPVHPLLELPPPIDPIVIPLPLPILLPGNMGLNPNEKNIFYVVWARDLWEVEVPVVDVQAPSVHSLQVNIYNTV
jgi:hypothetical protein